MKCTTDSTWCDHPGARGGSTVLHLLSLQLAVTNRERPGQRMPGAVGFAVAVADLAGDAPAPRGMIGLGGIGQRGALGDSKQSLDVLERPPPIPPS